MDLGHQFQQEREDIGEAQEVRINAAWKQIDDSFDSFGVTEAVPGDGLQGTCLGAKA